MTTSELSSAPWVLMSRRSLNESERAYPTEATNGPLVIEAKERRDIDFLTSELGRHAAAAKGALYQHGAILLRGFQVESEADFARVVSSIPGLRLMTGYFMAEVGRSRMSGGGNVFPTSTLVKTGGGFQFLGDGFHSENFHSLDTPGFQSFWCKKSPWLGGETALVHVGRAYAELSEDLKRKLETDPICKPRVWSVAEVAGAYGLSQDFVERFFEDFGLPSVTWENERYLVLCKPCVVRHPHTGQVVLNANLASELPSLGLALHPLLKQHYTGSSWALHRLCWRHPRLGQFMNDLERLPRLLRFHPEVLLERLRNLRGPDEKVSAERERAWRRQRELTGSYGLAHKLSEGDVQQLARALWKHCSAFFWRRGDILLWDNLQMLHAGLPGFGPRELGVILCNPLAFAYPLDGGVGRVLADDGYASVHCRLQQAQQSASLSS